jgi:hypothetical protein
MVEELNRPGGPDLVIASIETLTPGFALSVETDAPRQRFP